MRMCDVNHVRDLFEQHIPVINFGMLPDKSVRNRLLAHYLIEYLPSNKVISALTVDSERYCIPKLALADEVYLYTWPRVSLVNHPIEEPHKGDGRLGRCTPHSSLDKVTLMAGVRLYREIFEKEKKYGNDRVVHDVSALLDDPIFQGISDGANPLHAAFCYMLLFEPREYPVVPWDDNGFSAGMGDHHSAIAAYEKRIGSARSVSDLKHTLCYKIFHERTQIAELKAKNQEVFDDPEIPHEAMFVNAVVNWNNDLLLRMTRSYDRELADYIQDLAPVELDNSDLD